MTRLVWDQMDQRRFEAGVSQGVLYPLGGSGVPWNGLISVEESREGGDVESLYYDGVKTLDVVSNKTFGAKLTAFSSPPEFDPCKGLRSVVPGFVVTRQERIRFGLAYKTGVGDYYKLHLIYNALATPTSRSYQSMSDQSDPSVLTWQIDAVPPPAVGFRPTAHFIVDSRKTDKYVLQDLEDRLYGSATLTASLPSTATVSSIFNDFITEPIAEPI